MINILANKKKVKTKVQKLWIFVKNRQGKLWKNVIIKLKIQVNFIL